MARTVTISELKTRALRRAKMENSQFADSDEVDRLVREAVAELYDKLIEARGAHYYLSSAEAVSSAGGVLFVLPEDFYQLAAVYVNQSLSATAFPGPPLVTNKFFPIIIGTDKNTNGWQAIQPFGDQEAPGLMNATSATPYASQYRLRGVQNGADTSVEALDLIEIRPVPQSQFLLRVEYIPRASTESYSDPPTDPVVNGINGWEQWVVLVVARTLLDEEESDTTGIERELARLESRLASLASNRDEGRGERIQDTQGILDAQQLWGIPVRPRWWA